MKKKTKSSEQGGKKMLTRDGYGQFTKVPKRGGRSKSNPKMKGPERKPTQKKKQK